MMFRASKIRFGSRAQSFGRIRLSQCAVDPTEEQMILKNFFLRICCRLFGQWPSNPNATKWRLIVPEVTYWIHFVNEFFGALAIVNGLYCCFTSLGGIVKSFVEIVFMLETMFNLIYYRRRSSQFERLIIKMEEFFRPSDPQERIIRRSYLNRTKVAHYSLISTFTIGGLLFIFSPLVAESYVTPVNTVYFSIPREEFWGFCVTFALNILHIVNAASVLFLDLLIICLIWHAACKFVLLGEAFRNSNQSRRAEVRKWVREHQDAISYANEVNRVIAPLAIKSTIAVALYVIVSCLLLTHDLFLLELSKFFIVTAFSMLRFLACSWAADTMTKNPIFEHFKQAQDVGWTVYATPWTNLAPGSRKERTIIIQMCQKPITINAGRFLTAWSLHFCGQVYYKIFSSFSTIRAILRD